MKSGKFTDSISVYENTLQVLPEQSREAHDIVIWNLALAYVKVGEMAKADETLLKISEGQPTRISRKAAHMRTRIATAATTGVKISLNSEDPVASQGASSLGGTGGVSGVIPEDDLLSQMSSDSIRMLSLVDFKPGDLGCFQLLPNTKASREALTNILNTLPPFKTRWKVSTPVK